MSMSILEYHKNGIVEKKLNYKRESNSHTIIPNTPPSMVLSSLTRAYSCSLRTLLSMVRKLAMFNVMSYMKKNEKRQRVESMLLNHRADIFCTGRR